MTEEVLGDPWRGREGLACTALLKILKKQSRITELNEQKYCESSLFFSANKFNFYLDPTYMFQAIFSAN